MKTSYLPLLIIVLLLTAGHASAFNLSKINSLINVGAGDSQNSPQGLSDAAGIQKKIPLSPSFVLDWGSVGTGDGEFNIPFGVAVGTSTVLVTDRDNHRIQSFDHNGNYMDQFGTFGSGDGQFINADNIEVDPFSNAGMIFVSDWELDRVQAFNPGNNVYAFQFGSGGAGNGEFSRAYDIAIDTNYNIFVVDRLNHRVQVFDSGGNYVRQWGTQGGGNGQFDNPVTIAVDSLNNVYVADQTYNRIQKFDNSGNYILSWGGLGSGNGQFNDPYGIAVDSQDRVYVVDRGNHRVQIFDSAGSYISQFGAQGTGDGEFMFPAGIDISLNDEIYVVDVGNSRVQKWSY